MNHRSNSIPNITVTLEVTGLSPSRGSLYGGTLLTVTGQGFGTNASRVAVTVGSHACPVDSLADTELTCEVDYAGTAHTVTNQGTHKGAWSSLSCLAWPVVVAVVVVVYML